MADDISIHSPDDMAPAAQAAPRRPRLWPGLLLPSLTLICILLPGLVIPATFAQVLFMIVSPTLGALLFVLWWLLASHETWTDRWTLLGLFLAGGLGAFLVADPSMPLVLFLFGWPTVGLATVLAMYALARSAAAPRRTAVGVVMVVGWTLWALVRCEGVDGQVLPDLAWRWSMTSEQQYLKSLADSTRPTPATTDEPPIEFSEGDWPGFRGPRRNGHVPGTRIELDWEQHPPTEIWRRRIGPGWSSFALVGNRLFTQEQRGEEEVVLCLNADDGTTMWSQSTSTRFWEVFGGAGPRATPTYHDGHIFALGANGLLFCLEARNGDVVWTRNISQDGQAEVPAWGFASSPLIVSGNEHADWVIVFAGGGQDNSVLAYRTDNGELAWSAGQGTHSYSSPQLFEIDGIPQVLMVSEQGIDALDPHAGTLLWQHQWPMPGYRVVQPNAVGSRLLIGTNNGMGTRLLDILHQDDRWNAVESWTSRSLKPYFNDFVIHQDHIYGFDNSILVCLDLATGQRRWKGGRYGTGQMLLLPDQNLLLVTTEKTGEVVLLETDPTQHNEIARCKILTGKTWNHPVLSQGRLFVRNGEEAACFELALQE